MFSTINKKSPSEIAKLSTDPRPMSATNLIDFQWCTGSWGILARGEGHLGEVPVGGSASWAKCQLGEVQLGNFNLSDFLGTIFILIHFYLMYATNDHYSLSKI